MVHAKPMTSQSMHHKLPGSEILLRFKSKTCSVATTKQTVAVGIAVADQNAHFNIAVYIYIYILFICVHITLLCRTEEDPSNSQQRSTMPRSQGFQQKGRAQGLGQLTQTGNTAANRWQYAKITVPSVSIEVSNIAGMTQHLQFHSRLDQVSSGQGVMSRAGSQCPRRTTLDLTEVQNKGGPENRKASRHQASRINDWWVGPPFFPFSPIF